LIQVIDVTKRYGQHVAVDHVNFTVEKGEILGFLGPNGAGKTTTMNIITGYISATEGTVKVDGFDILDEPEEVKKRNRVYARIPAAVYGHDGARVSGFCERYQEDR
jgi:ABC-type multidrug transport system, ATPase component